MSEYNEGDLVEAVKGEQRIVGRINGVRGASYLGESARTVEALTDQDWTLTVIEKAAPRLPTEDGWYSVDAHGHPYCRMLRIGGGVITEFLASGATPEKHYTPDDLAKIALREGRLTRMEPVADTAKKVLNEVRLNLYMPADGKRPDGTFALSGHVFDSIATEFGVTNDH